MSHAKRQLSLLAVLVAMTSSWSDVSAAEITTIQPLTPESVRVSGDSNEETIERSVVVATTDIKDAQIVVQNGHDVTLLFNLYNAVGVQSGIVYGVELYTNGTNGRQLIDTKVYGDTPLTLGVGETLPVSMTYGAPTFLSGKHEVWLVAKTQSGMPLSLARVGNVEFVGVGNHVGLSDCTASVGGASYPLTAGVDIAPNEALSVACTAHNTFDEAKEVSVQFSTYERSVYGPMVETVVPTAQSVLVPADATTKVSFSVPTALKAQAYDAVLELVDTAGTVISPKVIVHYVIQGESATLQNAVFDKSSYAIGETAEVMVSWSLSADAFHGARGGGSETGPLTMSVVMADRAGQFCSAPAVLSLQGAGLTSQFAVPVLRDCTDPHLIVGLTDATGASLSDQSFNYTPVVIHEELDAPATALSLLITVLLMVVSIPVLLFVAIKLLSYIRSRVPAPTHLYEPTTSTQSPGASGVALLSLLFTVVMGSGLLFVVSVSPAAAATLNVTSGFDTVTFTVNTNKSTYLVGEPVEVFGAAFVTGCGNAIADGGLEAVDGKGVTRTIGTFNMDPYSLPGGFAMFDKFIDGYSSPGAKLMPVRAYVIVGGITNSSLGSLPLMVMCTEGANWNGTACISSTPHPAATLTGGGCYIAAEESTCVSSLNWSIENATVPSVRNVTTNTLYSYDTTGINESRTITHGVNVVAAYEAATSLATAPVVGSCVSGTSWNGSVCATDGDPSATISATACEIVVGDSTCGVTLDWEILAATTPNVYNDTTDVPVASAATGNDVPLTIAHGSYNIQARDGLTELATAVATASCEDGSTWDGSVCIVTGGAGSITVSLTANGDQDNTDIAIGDDVYLEWEVTGNVDVCTASNDWTGTRATPHGAEWSMNVVTDKIYTLSCTGLTGTVNDQIVVHTKTPANLLPIGLSLSPSTSFNLATGNYDKLYVQYSIRNDGKTDAGSFLNRIKLDRGNDSIYDESVNDSIDTGLAAETDSPLSPILLALNVPFGTHRVYIGADVLDTIEEGDEDDNEDTLLLTVPVPNPHLELTADPTFIRSGQSTTLTWDINVTFPMDCRLRGPKVSRDIDPSSDGPTGMLTVTALTAKSEFMLQCAEPTTGTVFTVSDTVEVLPTIQEI